jgi:cellulose synthase/poly-beta-1,6-N-acetylglucosamine synthase-like glycosyltransferase
VSSSQSGPGSGRPSVSVVVPFLGTDSDLRALARRLGDLNRRAGDELIVADNRSVTTGLTELAELGDVLVHPAGGLRSPSFARNQGAAKATGEWIVFIDADTEPHPDLLDAYFDPAPADDTGILAGGIQDVPPASENSPPTVTSRHAVARGHMEDRMTLERPRFAYAQTANCAIRRSAFFDVGGFVSEARAGEDADLCFRLADQGWGLERRPHAVVRHRTRATLRGSLAQLIRHGSGAAWCNRRHPGSFPPPTPRALAGRIASELRRTVTATAAGDRETAEFALLDLVEGLAFAAGRLVSNQARR